MTAILVREAEARDLPAVFALVAALLGELGEEGEEAGSLPFDDLAARLAEIGGRHRAFLAEAPSGEAVGVLTLAEGFALYAGGDYGIINEMFVAPAYRSDGVGARLIAAAAEHGRARGWRRIDVTAPESERWSRPRRFYETQGFTFAGPKLKLLLPR